MAQYTTNYNIPKIDLTDAPPDITVLNPGFDIIDSKLKQLEDIGGVYIPAAQKGAANGVAELDGDGKVPISQIPKSLLDFDYYMNLYGYTYTQTDDEEAGTTTIAVTLDSSSPVTGTLTAVISESEDGDTVIDVTTVLDGVTTKYQHTLNDEGGEGGIYNG